MPRGVHNGQLRGENHPMVKSWLPPCPESQLREMYEAKRMSQREIAQSLCVSLKRIQTAMRRFGITPRPQTRRNQHGPANPCWKGEEAGYQAMHLRVARKRGKPQRCERCGTSDPRKHYDWANLTGRYGNVDDYERMCRSCHRRYDYERVGGDAECPKSR